MQILLTGGTGFIGKHLTKALISRGHDVVIVTRRTSQNPQDKVKYISWDTGTSGILPENTPPVDAVINLAGESIGNNKWSPQIKEKILKSRVETTKAIVNSIEKKIINPKTLINASAIGYYGTDEERLFSENDVPGTDFLANVCKAWEAEAIKAERYNVRTIMVRTGLVLGNEGALQKMITPFKFFAGGSLGNGRQWLSWIHIDDLINIYIHTLEHNDISGPINAVAPNPVRMSEFAKTLGKAMQKPAILPAPGFALKIILGEMSDLVLKGQQVSANKIINSGFRFDYPELSGALENLLK